jgi:hypothetical protein
VYLQGAVLRVTKPERKRNRIITILLLPAVALLWLLGWSMYILGRTRDDKPKVHAKRENANVTLVSAAAVEEEPLEVQT